MTWTTESLSSGDELVSAAVKDRDGNMIIAGYLQHSQPSIQSVAPKLLNLGLRVVHLGRSTCHAISYQGDWSTRIPDG